MITPAPAPQQPQISPLDWVGDPDECPPWVGFPTRAGLEATLVVQQLAQQVQVALATVQPVSPV